MKRVIILLSALLLVAGCGVGSHTVVSGLADEAAVVFFSPRAMTVDVTVDDMDYRVNTVKDSEFKAKRNIKDTANNMIIVKPGTHEVTVRFNGATILNQKIFVSAGDTKVIKL